jgi:hypothetical protein
MWRTLASVAPTLNSLPHHAGNVANSRRSAHERFRDNFPLLFPKRLYGSFVAA